MKSDLTSHIRLSQTSDTELKAQNWGGNAAVWQVAPSLDTVGSKNTLNSECIDNFITLSGLFWHSEDNLGNAYVTVAKHAQK